jgi:hypothetical protein
VGVTGFDRFWAQVNLDLLDLPQPSDVLEKLEAIDQDLYLSLVKGERWLLWPKRTLQELQAGWAWWYRLYREAVQIMAARSERLAG